MSMLNAVRTYLTAYTGLVVGAPVWVDFLGARVTEYSVVSLPGEKAVEEYINGGSVREFHFAFQSMESTSDDLGRLGNASFFETFAEWLEQQTVDGNFPTLGTGQTAIAIEATSWGYLFEQGSSGTGIYQITAKLTYEQAPVEKTEV